MKIDKMISNLIVYITTFALVIYLVGGIMVYFYNNIKVLTDDMNIMSNFTKFDLYMLRTIKTKNTEIRKIGTVSENDENSYFITFENEDGTTTSFIKKGNLLYYNEIKLCDHVDSFRIFVDKSEKESITVEMIIGGETRSFQYAMIEIERKNMKYEFEVIGDIKGKGRPRMNTLTGAAYTPNNTRDYENLIRQYFKIKYPKYVPFENRVSVSIKAYFKVPKNTNKKNAKLMLKGSISPAKKPDIDNVVKVVFDALNKMAFKDDNQITKLEIEKFYAEEEKIVVIVEEY